MKEIYKPIKGFEKLYEVSNLGNVRVKERPLNGTKRKGYRKIKLLKQFIVLSGKSKNRSDGYFHVSLSLRKGHKIKKKVHRLIAIAFIPNPQNKPHINHINSNRNDNRIENLEWCTPKENVEHCIKMGRFPMKNLKNQN